MQNSQVVELVDALFLDDGRKQDFGIGSNPILITRADWSQQESVPRRRSELTITGEGVVAQW